MHEEAEQKATELLQVSRANPPARPRRCIRAWSAGIWRPLCRSFARDEAMDFTPSAGIGPACGK
jgi:hypothetical protein